MPTRRGFGAAALLGAFAAGGAAVYWLDVDHGRRRRGRARNLAIHLGHRTREVLDKGSRDLRHRASGAVAELRRALAPEDWADDDVLVARVRSEIGRASSHPHAIAVGSQDGSVHLEGHVLASEADQLCHRVARVRGVRDVFAEGLERHVAAEGVPALQGGRPNRRSGPLRERARWTPAERLVGGALGAALALAGLGQRRVPGRILLAGGAALVTRAMTNVPARRLVGLGGGERDEVELRKSLLVEAPVEQVFAFFTDFENFPRFMQHVRQVKRLDVDRSRWVVEGPAGIAVRWDAQVTRVVPNDTFAWKTTGSSPVRHAGLVRFGPWGDGTRVDLHVTYQPAGGMLGRAVAALLGANPKRALDEDMLRFKSLLERGKTVAHGVEVTREDLRH